MVSSSGSADEGEIVENGVAELKATTLVDRNGYGVDRQDRTRSRYSRSPGPAGPDHGRSFGNSSLRNASPRGYKRSRDDRGTQQGGNQGSSDPRRFRVHYEDGSREDPRYPRSRFDDLDRPPSSRGGSYRQPDLDYPRGSGSRPDRRGLGYDERDRDRDRYPDKRPRTRSRSPPHSSRGGRGRRDRDRRDQGRFDRNQNGAQAESIQYSTQSEKKSREETLPKLAPMARALRDGETVAKSTKGVTDENKTESYPKQLNGGSQEGTAEQGAAPQQDWEEEQPMDVEAEIERRRRRREELLRKSRASTPMHLLSLQADKTNGSTPGGSTEPPTPHRTGLNTPRSAGESPAGSPAAAPDGMSPGAMELSEQDLMNMHCDHKSSINEEDGPSAADYDPTNDMREDERRDELRHGHVVLHGEQRRGSLVAGSEPEQRLQLEATEEHPAAGDGDDAFDMFAEFDEDNYVPPQAAKAAVVIDDKADGLPLANTGGILEGDDKDGYYKMRPGEILNGRYQIQSALGKGMFSGVARALDITDKSLHAIKIMRNNDALRKGGFTEIAILQKLNEADPDSKKHIVKFERSFEYKGHLCMVFENLSLNLREVLKKFGHNVGINLKGVRVYAYQIFLALAHMRKCSIIHADLKPDNILVNDSRSLLKICDLGTAIDRSDAATAHNEITPYLVSRFYRAPEIILGIPYDYGADMWSIGCTLYEMYTGKILFAGDSNNQMLKAIMEIRGKISGKLYRRGELWRLHFDDLGNFISQERDKVLGKTNIRTLPMIKRTRDLRTRLLAASGGMGEADAKELNLFHDLLDRCLNVNPDKRITPHDALKHPFFASRVNPSSGR